MPVGMTGAVLGFAHTVGEFGVVLMIDGNPGRTKVLSVAIYDYVESLQWAQAHILAAGMLVFSFGVILSWRSRPAGASQPCHPEALQIAAPCSPFCRECIKLP
jgi:molybdate transport system permease protein